MVKISQNIINEIKYLVSQQGYKVTFNSAAKFQAETFKKTKSIVIKNEIEIDDFNYLFTQNGEDYDVKRDQEMFIFNTLHEIGHIVLDLWKMKSSDEIANRLHNLEIDKTINKWAYDQLIKWRKQKSS